MSQEVTGVDVLSELFQSIAYTFQNESLLKQALTHKSASKDVHNERLEFLGDAVFELVISDLLMKQFVDDEGGLSKKRASLVNEGTLAQICLRINLQKHMILGRSEAHSSIEKKPRLLASVLEALIGALYLDGGFQEAYRVIQKMFEPWLLAMDPSEDFSHDYKTKLQELLQSEHKLAPAYRVKKETGPSHDKEFVIEVEFQDRVLGRGAGRSKKAAEQEAAKEALSFLTKEIRDRSRLASTEQSVIHQKSSHEKENPETEPS